ncbi:hypothetical protein LCGC14_1577290 [marine sediment metagenome]|uniref:Uncharacterized protein n=1 Tax=marine sediment metagenome TaxID=412755 RepID=A0A0F9IHX0_9ZZZZ
MKFQDVIAGAMTIILLLALIAFALLEIDTPEELRLAFGVSIGWVFSRGVNGKIDAIRKGRENADGKDA